MALPEELNLQNYGDNTKYKFVKITQNEYKRIKKMKAIGWIMVDVASQ